MEEWFQDALEPVGVGDEKKKGAELIRPSMSERVASQLSIILLLKLHLSE